jgi:nucleotide-binding universal stress UspA family protein
MTVEVKATATGEWEGTHEPIVVAVDGSERNRSAVAWAAREAAALGCDLVLVTALQDYVVATPHFSMRSEDQETLDMLADARAAVRHILDEKRISTVAVAGSPVDVLLDRAAEARLLVVGKRGLGGFARMIVGSTSIALAGRSPVPVVIVPDGWEQTGHDGRPVVLGVDPNKPDDRPIEVAFRRAKRLGVPLVAAHGWETPAVFSWDAETVTGAVTEHDRQAEALFDELLRSWQERHPDVVIRPMRVHKHPATAVLEAAEEAQVVVLGRHGSGMFGGFAFGSVARAVLHYAECPVVVAPAGNGAHKLD